MDVSMNNVIFMEVVHRLAYLKRLMERGCRG